MHHQVHKIVFELKHSGYQY